VGVILIGREDGLSVTGSRRLSRPQGSGSRPNDKEGLLLVDREGGEAPSV